MAPSSDDRDRNFETALARHFRASAQPETTPASPSCADIEALATYHEGGLSPEQRSLWKTHVQGCARCQEVLAQLAATDAIPLDVAGNDAEENLDKQKIAGPPVVLKPRKPTLWRWAAPAGAIAAGLLVWITVRENKPVQISEVHDRKEASSAPLVATPKPPEPESKTTANEQQPVAPKPSAIAGAAGVVQQKRDSNRAARVSVVPSMPTPTGRERTAENSANLYATAPPQPEVRNRTDAAAKDLKEKAPAFLPPAAAPAPPDASEVSAMSETVEVEAAPAVPLQTAKSATGNPSDRIALQKQELPLNGRNSQALVLLTKGVGGVIIAAPQGSVEWRIGAAGLVEHSSDAGATWTLQSTGVVADLLAGSAISDKVCWIVGRSGTILRTTDGGAHWSKLPPPIIDDFASVFAVNARQATVSPANGTYQTKDGGATWKKLAPE
jgi:hypothetical protein